MLDTVTAQTFIDVGGRPLTLHTPIGPIPAHVLRVDQSSEERAPGAKRQPFLVVVEARADMPPMDLFSRVTLPGGETLPELAILKVGPDIRGELLHHYQIIFN
jgi:hypothetical protein